VNVYTLSFFLMGLSMTCLWYYAQWRGLATGPSRRIITLTTRLYLLTAVIPAGMFLLSFVTIPGCLALSAVMFAIFLFPKAVVKRLAGSAYG
jgi:hypothetical protein